jgi:hypothetical protein
VRRTLGNFASYGEGWWFPSRSRVSDFRIWSYYSVSAVRQAIGISWSGDDHRELGQAHRGARALGRVAGPDSARRSASAALRVARQEAGSLERRVEKVSKKRTGGGSESDAAATRASRRHRVPRVPAAARRATRGSPAMHHI